MTHSHLTAIPIAPEAVLAAARAAVQAIPPAWPLDATVAVNPYLGQIGEPLDATAARLARVAGVRTTMPRAWYRAQIAGGAITRDDLAASLDAAGSGPKPASVDALEAALSRESAAPTPLPTVAELATRATGTDWSGIVAERIGAWAAAYFDAGQALWSVPAEGAYASWRAQARHDRTPDMLGLDGFARSVADAPESGQAALRAAVARMGLGEAMLPLYFHRLLVDLGGWSQLARFRLWQAELAGGDDATAIDLLAVRVFWEAALLARFELPLATSWPATRIAYAEPPRPGAEEAIDAVLQEAAERAAQRRLVGALSAATPGRAATPVRPAVQAVFCIDVRSEVFRRAFESLDPRIATLGFAGFFGVALTHRRAASDVPEARCPVLLSPALATQAQDATDASSRILARARRAWTRFQTAAVSSFTFVEAAGPLYAVKLARDALGMAPAELAGNEPPPRLETALSPEARIDAAEAILRAMSLTGGFARLVVLAGHGAGVVNNPHASALHCGACGGYQGDANARLVAALLNDPEARAGVAARGIAIPTDTLFVGALHDTTSDTVTLFDTEAAMASGHQADLAQLRAWLAAAGRLARTERALRLPAARAETLARRGRDWSEIRPEWALAGCSAFIAAPRARTLGRDLGGRAFLHSYAWRDDLGFKVLELIMTAPVVVASWISLQYYGSCVAPELFGSGNKLLHNVVGGIGVVEGNGGRLRAGLPWQSVHDGARFAHEPLRLTVVIEAPRAAMSDIISRHPMLQALFDNRWLHLLALDEAGRVAWRYAGKLAWEPVDGVPLRAAG